MITITDSFPETYKSLANAANGAREPLFQHPVYRELRSLTDLRRFMETHVFAVWDFMSLLKTLQSRLAPAASPWIPPLDPASARIVNELVLAEESDDLIPGTHASHFESYLAAMREVGASVSVIEECVDRVRAGEDPVRAMALAKAPAAAIAFVENTLRICEGEIHEVAAAFFLGREDIIPGMFRSVLSKADGALAAECPLFVRYLERHIELDSGTHSELGARLLARLCGDSPQKWAEAQNAALESLEARRQLWDSVVSH